MLYNVYLKLYLCDMNDYTVWSHFEALVFSLDSIRALHQFVVLPALLCRREPLREREKNEKETFEDVKIENKEGISGERGK